MKVKRMFRKSLAVLMAVSMLVQLGGMTYAVGDEEYTEIIVDCGVDCEKAQLIINAINGETSTYQAIAPASIFCIFGHNMAQTTAVEINHRVWSTSPRCRETRYRVNYCTRSSCNYVVTTLLTQGAIHCC